MVMWLNSEISGGVGARSTYFKRDHQVDDENRYGQYPRDQASNDEKDIIEGRCTQMHTGDINDLGS